MIAFRLKEKAAAATLAGMDITVHEIAKEIPQEVRILQRIDCPSAGAEMDIAKVRLRKAANLIAHDKKVLAADVSRCRQAQEHH